MYLALIILLLIFAVIIFQAFILFGAPWGEYTMGGKYPGVIPQKLRYLTIIQILVLFGFAYIIAEKTGFLGIKTNIFGEIGIWFVFAFFCFRNYFELDNSKQKRTPSLGSSQHSNSCFVDNLVVFPNLKIEK